MGSIINVDFESGRKINLESLNNSRNGRDVPEGLLTTAKEEMESNVLVDHTSEPIKDPKDIDRICDYLLEQERYRDYMLFVVGINVGLRVSDLRLLRFGDLIEEDAQGNMRFKRRLTVFEIKTRNTKKRKHNRYITINQAVIEAVLIYLKHNPGTSLSDYLFRSESNMSLGNEPIHRNSIDRILKGIAKDLNLDVKMSTHTLRKTFAYHQMLMSGNDSRKLILLSKMFGHSSVAMTMEYIGITNEEMADAYNSLNLGLRSHYVVDSEIQDVAV